MIAPGQTIVYFKGDLATTRAVLSSGQHVANKAMLARKIRAATTIMYIAEMGLLHLTQRRVGESMFEYRLMRSTQHDTPDVKRLMQQLEAELEEVNNG